MLIILTISNLIKFIVISLLIGNFSNFRLNISLIVMSTARTDHIHYLFQKNNNNPATNSRFFSDTLLLCDIIFQLHHTFCKWPTHVLPNFPQLHTKDAVVITNEINLINKYLDQSWSACFPPFRDDVIAAYAIAHLATNSIEFIPHYPNSSLDYLIDW